MTKTLLTTDMSFHYCFLILQAILSQPAVNRYASTLQKLGDTSMVMKLYFCGPLDHPEKLKNVLKNGFSESGIDFYDCFCRHVLGYCLYIETFCRLKRGNHSWYFVCLNLSCI